MNLLLNPELAAFPSSAFKIAAWFWKSNAYIVKSTAMPLKGSLNELVDGSYHNFTLITHSLTEKLNEYSTRVRLNDMLLEALNSRPLKRGKGINCIFSVPVCLPGQSSNYCGCEGENQDNCPYGNFSNSGKCKNPKTIRCCVEKFSKSSDLVLFFSA